MSATAAPGPLNASSFRLARSSYASVITSLDKRLPTASVSAVLDDSDHVARPISAAQIKAKNFVQGFAWDAGDANTTFWYPQGVTTSADASASGLYFNRKVTLVSWHNMVDTDHNPATKPASTNVRVSFVDRTNPARPVYRHVLLVQPYMDGSTPTYRAASDVHAGGIAWYGNYLYVAASTAADKHGGVGLRVFDLSHIFKVDTAKNYMGHNPDGHYYAQGTKYVVPQILNYKVPLGAPDPGLSWVSLDRTTSPHSLLIGQFKSRPPGSTGVDNCRARIVRWSLNNNHELVTSAGIASATWAREISTCSVQGATSINGVYYLNRNSYTGSGLPAGGDLFTWVPGRYTHAHPRVLPRASNDLSYDPGTNELWTLTEGPATGRFVYSVRPNAFP